MWHFILSMLFLSTHLLFPITLTAQLSDKFLYEHAVKTRKEKRILAQAIGQFFNGNNAPQSQEDSFLGKTEIKELELAWLTDTLDLAQTALGRLHLSRFDQLITDNITVIQGRQHIEKILTNHPELLRTIQNNLYAIGQKQDSLLAYFDQTNRLNALVEDFYFDGSSIDWFTKKGGDVLKKGNNYTSTLNVNVGWSIVKRCDSIFVSLCKQSITDEMIKIALGLSTAVHLDAFLLDNIVNTVKGHLPWYSKFDKDNYSGSLRNYSEIMQEGTFSDKLGAYVCGSNGGDNYIGFKYIPGLTSVRYTWRKQADFTQWNDVAWYKKAIAGISLLGWTLYKDYRMLEDGKDSVKRIKQLFRIVGTLRARLMRVSETIVLIKNLSKTINAYPEIQQSNFAQQLATIVDITGSEKFKTVITLLKNDTFKSNASNFYNYGSVLRAHRLLNEIKTELIPILNALGELDAYCSIATLLAYHKDDAATFSFVDFKESDKPYVYLEDCWVPLINPARVVTNTITLGTHAWGNKVIITGPNGGGKSTFLKSLGHAVYLAHTFGIVPASRGVITPFTGLRTCFHPQESLSEDMSQFMIEKLCMDKLSHYLSTLSTGDNVMILIDEPYRGTVDAESAERIYAFGKKAAQIPEANVVIATHVQKPIELAVDTHNIFTNCQVIIKELDKNRFERTFKVMPDVAYWWFDDHEKRSRFVDWLAINQSPYKQVIH